LALKQFFEHGENMENVDVAFPHSSTHLWVVTYEL